MFANLFRRSSPRPAARLSLRLEALDGRVLPGGLAGGVFPSGGLTTAVQVGHADPQSGEEIPHTGAGGGQVDTFASKPTSTGDW